ncbi:hypothetical protein RKE30_09035 [Streptomyces sp. Li-HN-5-11]|uniref:hypothetical protein n=1 Tax=Streptomyces sp. Li-HN-5-11 TaxID=3075432 RepID=UPI0028B1FD98|nr:hypothetical protein [Streptomyces sp. Li-HN-5-11]WNM30538.1 hypothetical protein RKE30_09035 [Streptomyces sp. Li-HN-5-11]
MAGLAPGIRRKTTEYAAVPLKNFLTLRRVVWAGVVVAVVAAAWAGWKTWDHSRLHDDEVGPDVLMSDHGRTLTTKMFWGACEYKPHLEVHESAHVIALVAKRKWHTSRESADECGYGGDAMFSVTLDHPVEGRKIIDSFDGRRIIPFDDAHFPCPQDLPSGYTPAKEDLRRLGSGTALLDNKARTPEWTTFYQQIQGEQVGAVEVTAVTGETTPTAGNPMTFNGHPGRLQKNGTYDWTAAWTQNGYTIAVHAQDPSMTDAQFLRITQSLRN